MKSQLIDVYTYLSLLGVFQLQRYCNITMCRHHQCHARGRYEEDDGGVVDTPSQQIACAQVVSDPSVEPKHGAGDASYKHIYDGEDDEETID